MSSIATARVWAAAAGVAGGILWARHGWPTKAAIACLTIGLLLVTVRRARVPGLLGVTLLAMSVASFLPVPVFDASADWGGPVVDGYRNALARALVAAPDRPAALLAGLTIGDTSGIDYATTELFRRSGLAHLVAVSGSNVAMVLAAIAVLTARLPLAVRAGIGAIGLLAYVAVVGPEPSVLRAAAMGLVGLVAYVSGRQTASLNTLGIAVIAVLAFKPELLFSVGLQLSVAATLGIVVWARPIEAGLHVLPGLVRAPMSITLAAQLGVAPLLILAFERLSLVAPVANLLAAPAVPPATLLGLGSGMAGLVAPSLGRLAARIAAPFSQWILWVSDETGAWSWSSVDIAPLWGWVLAVPVGLATLVQAARAPRSPG